MPDRRPTVSGTLGLLRESRAVVEYGGLARRLGSLRQAPAGDGHPVVVLPGWLAGDGATFVLRRFLQTKGYRVRGWGRGVNWGGRDDFEGFVDDLAADHAAGRPPVSLIGWSLGGICARLAAHRVPGAVRQVVTLASPFRDDPRQQPFWPVYRRLSGASEADFQGEELALVASLPPVPTTAVVSTDDAIVDPASASERATETSETLVVRGTHTGLCHNPDVLDILADRLAQTAGRWRRYRPIGPRVAQGDWPHAPA